MAYLLVFCAGGLMFGLTIAYFMAIDKAESESKWAAELNRLRRAARPPAPAPVAGPVDQAERDRRLRKATAERERLRLAQQADEEHRRLAEAAERERHKLANLNEQYAAGVRDLYDDSPGDRGHGEKSSL